jgi:UDP-glucose 4-epimerase
MILITGGSGYIGSHTNKYISNRGYETVVLDSLIYGHKEFNLWGKFYNIDLANIDGIRKVFTENDIEAVIHFAAFAYIGESVIYPEKYYLNNVKNTLNLLQVMNEFKVKKIIFSSTCATYGEQKFLPIDETHPQNPINPYGTSKFFVERIIKDYHNAYGLEYCIFRYFNAAGADIDCEIGEWHEPETHLIPLVLDVPAGKRDLISIFGNDYPTHDGTNVRDYIHVTDLADAHFRGLEHLMKSNKSDIFNLGNGNGFSNLDVINAAENITGMKIRKEFAQRRLGDPAILVGSSQKIREVLNWEPKYFNLETIISSAWEWHKKLNKI